MVKFACSGNIGEDNKLICMGHPIKLIDVNRFCSFQSFWWKVCYKFFCYFISLYFKVEKRAPFRNILDVSRGYYLLKKEEGENGKFSREFGLLLIYICIYICFSFQNKSKNVIKLYKHDKLVL